MKWFALAIGALAAALALAVVDVKFDEYEAFLGGWIYKALLAVAALSLAIALIRAARGTFDRLHQR
jgi:hypothetical protein